MASEHFSDEELACHCCGEGADIVSYDWGCHVDVRDGGVGAGIYWEG